MTEVQELHPTGAFRYEVAMRVRQALAARNVKKSIVADWAHINQSSFSKRVNGHIAFDMGEIATVAHVAGINRDWLLTGHGQILDDDWVPPAGFEPAAFCSQELPCNPVNSVTISCDSAAILPFVPRPH